MLSGSVTNRYTLGIYKVASETGKVEAVDKSLQLLADIISEYPEFKLLIEHPLVDADAKTTAVKNVLGESIEPTVIRLLHTLFSRGRSAYVTSIAQRFHEFAEDAKGIVTVGIESAAPLTEVQVTALENGLSKALNKQAHAVVTVLPDLIAGYRVKVGNRILDATVSGALAQFGNKLLAGNAIKEGTH